MINKKIINELNEEVRTSTYARFGVDASTILFWVFNAFMFLSGAWYWTVRIGAWVIDVLEGK